MEFLAGLGPENDRRGFVEWLALVCLFAFGCRANVRMLTLQSFGYQDIVQIVRQVRLLTYEIERLCLQI